MSRRTRQRDVQAVTPEPIDVVDGIPDRSQHRSFWKYLLIGLVFLGWVAFLVYCHLAGNV